jgi:hypothetical protein
MFETRFDLDISLQDNVFQNRGIIESGKIIILPQEVKQIFEKMILRIGMAYPQMQHRFVYGINNPVNKIDPWGLAVESVPIWEDPLFYIILAPIIWVAGDFIIIGRYIGTYSRPVVIGIVSRIWQWGIRLDFPHHEKWFHPHWPWNW